MISVKKHCSRWVSLCLALSTLTAINSHDAAAQTTIVVNGQSTHSIVVPQLAPESVNDAAAEMQRSIKEATGATLPIRKDNETLGTLFISLGSTQQAKTAGISTEGVADEGFRIVTKNGNLFIIGPDTTTIDLNRKIGRTDQETLNVELHPEIPGPAFTKNGGFSYGTANGVYTFLENYVGVRWLMPGDLGRDVPQKSTLVVDEINRTHAPMFSYRVLPLLGRSPETYDWINRQRLGFSYRINHRHSTRQMVPAELFEQHPNWFAMDSDGKRIKPVGKSYQIETTNPELVEYFAGKAVEALKAEPQLHTFSISPNDGAGFSQSKESKALYDPAPPGSDWPSITPLVLKWYRDVSQAAARKDPQAKISGYIYGFYRHPPRQGSMELPKNFIPVLTATASGYASYRADRREEDAYLLEAWSKVAPDDWFYYTFWTWLTYSTGMVQPPATDSMNFLFSNLVKNNIKGVFYYGTPTWSQAALNNYMAAQLMWNPKADAREIQREWLRRAYGPKAGAVMEELYTKMDESWWADYFRQPDSALHNVSEALFARTYGVHYPKMEALFLEAQKQPMTPIQQQRLKLIGDNFRVLQWRLRNASYLPAEYSSPLTVNTKQVYDLLTASGEAFSPFPNVVQNNGGAITPVKVQLGAQQGKVNAIPNATHILLYPTRAGEVRIKPTKVLSGSNFVMYYVQDENGRRVERGLLSAGEDIVFSAQANKPYYLQIAFIGITAKATQIKWEFSIPRAAPAEAGFENGTLFLQSAQPNAPLYVHAPKALSLNNVGNEAGVTLFTRTTEQQKAQIDRANKQAEVAALNTALQRYQATQIQSLNNGWKFNTDPDKIGVQQEYFKPGFNDGDWKPIRTVGTWQHHGFDYHGTAWYRNTVTVAAKDLDPQTRGDKRVLLFFGSVDGSAVFYLNGKKIGEHVLADPGVDWQVPVTFDVTDQIAPGKNTIAVQVTKNQAASGIYRGAHLLLGVLPKP